MQNMQSVTSLSTRTDVTDVKIYKNHVLAGIGSFVHIYDKVTAKLVTRKLCLIGQKIYGFVLSKCGQKILVFGGKQFTVLTLNINEDSIVCTIQNPTVCDDWLHSGLWIDDNIVAVLTAHNVVQKWDTQERSLITQHMSEHNSILYSGLLLPLLNDILVFAGTVFSEVIIHRCDHKAPLHNLKGHRGVIFSISCDVEKELIVTTSDDRSVRLWTIKSIYQKNSIEYWNNAQITCLFEVYGHAARVMRCCVVEKLIISVGEDSSICLWDFEGKLCRKITAHQNACIWSLDADEDYLVTGGGDCGVSLHPLTVAFNYGHYEILDSNGDTPKKIIFTARKNVVILNENNLLVYYNLTTNSRVSYNLQHESTYKLLSVSSCKQLIAVADMNGKLDVFIENCKDEAFIINVIDTKLEIGKVLSMHWAGNRHFIICTENGGIKILAAKGNTVEFVDDFILPPCTERWLTAVAMDCNHKVFVLGDRCGNIHVFAKGQKDPVKTFKKIHGRYGPTSIVIQDGSIITTGRDGTIKTFTIDKEKIKMNYMNAKEVEFQWIEKFLDKDCNLICGFQERVFIVCNVKTHSKLLEVPCGGGHRSWDAIRYIDKVNDKFEEIIKLMYIKNSEIHIATFQMSNIVSKNIVKGSHGKEINCLKTVKDANETFYISGGEDTTLRISSMNEALEFEDRVIFKQLSSVRSIKILKLEENRLLMISAGGRAQICVKTVTFEKTNNETKVTPQDLINYQIKGSDKERKGSKSWRNCSIDFNPETRIMSVDLMAINDRNFFIFAGCSDTYLRVYKLTLEPITELKPVTESKLHKTCILITNYIQFHDINFIVTCSTRGEVTFSTINNEKSVETIEIKPVFTAITNKSGITSFASKILSKTEILISTAGDDNSIHLVLLDIVTEKDVIKDIKVTSTWNSDRYHCSQITGLILLEKALISASIDQRVTVLEWKVEETITCEFISQAFSDVADIHGMELVELIGGDATLCVYGKGMEVLSLPVPYTPGC